MSSDSPSSSPPKLPIIGLIGGIGSGKSTVARMLAELGCLVADSDAMGHQALEDERIREQIRHKWGTEVFAPGAGSPINRTALAQKVFADPSARKHLESLVHPWIEERRAELFSTPPKGTRALVIDAPLLLEAGLGPQCDAIIFVESPESVRQNRVAATRGWDPAELSRREAAQLPLDQKRLSAHHVLRNDGSSDALQAQVRQVLSEVCATKR
jgi:dephospho-CoA kinase